MHTRVNIPRDNLDPFARYWRYQIIISSGKGNTTKIENLSSIAHQLGRDPDIIANFLKKELGTSVKKIAGDKNGSKSSRSNQEQKYSIGGQFSVDQLEDLLEKFIDREILCQQCGNPETSVENGSKRCRACGF